MFALNSSSQKSRVKSLTLIKSSFFIGLLLLIHTQAIQAYTITDLMSTDLTAFTTEVTTGGWTISSHRTPGYETTMCTGMPILGGYLVAGGGGGAYFERTYTDIPDHNEVYITFMAYPVDSWDIEQADQFFIFIDGFKFYGWKIWSFGNSALTNTCGLSGYVPTIQPSW